MRSKIFVTSFLALVASSVQSSLPFDDKDCHPTPKTDTNHYIVGYGSLINAESKGKTYPDTGINIPVRVRGFKRTWTARGYSNSSLSTTYLGIEIDPESYLNGVVFSVPNADALFKYDERERYYCRVNVPWEDLTILRGRISDNGTFPPEGDLKKSEFWIYVTIPKYSEYPDERYPIVQSYVDIFLGGCVQMERKYGLSNYAEECVTKTQGWDHPWVNDRLQPRRPWTYQPEARTIDRLITKYLPDFLSRVHVERITVERSGGSGGNEIAVDLLPLVSATLIALFNKVLMP